MHGLVPDPSYSWDFCQNGPLRGPLRYSKKATRNKCQVWTWPFPRSDGNWPLGIGSAWNCKLKLMIFFSGLGPLPGHDPADPARAQEGGEGAGQVRLRGKREFWSHKKLIFNMVILGLADQFTMSEFYVINWLRDVGKMLLQGRGNFHEKFHKARQVDERGRERDLWRNSITRGKVRKMFLTERKGPVTFSFVRVTANFFFFFWKEGGNTLSIHCAKKNK